MSTKTTLVLEAGTEQSQPSIKAIRPPNPSASKRREAQYLRRADALAAEGQVEKALVHLRKLVSVLPQSTQGYLRMAALLRREKRCGEAVEVLRGAVAHSPRCLASRGALAETCLESGRWDEAIAHSKVLLALSPHSLFAREVLSAAYLQRGLIDQALRVTEEMIRLDPLDATSHYKRGVLLQQRGQIGAAIQAFTRALEMRPEPDVADELRSALEILDSIQIRQILTLAVEDVPFRLRLLDDPGDAIAEKGFLLSPCGLHALEQIGFDDLPEAPCGWRQYTYH